MQIRETGTGNYPPVVYQPLRSPKSPYAKFGPGSSCTLPAKLNARLLMDQIVVNNGAKLNQPCCGNEVVQSGVVGVDETDSIVPRLQFDANSTILPRFLHSTTNPKSLRQSTPPSHSDNIIDLNDNTESNHHHQHHHFINHHCQHHHHNNHSHQHNQIITIDETEHPAKHNHPSVDRNIRGSSEENSNASSDHTNGGYFSEDSSQSITDLYGSSMELKVQIRQCSDEKILKKNLSQDNLLRADYISRPNKKCEYAS